jgi:hypothetical protein
MAHGRMRLEIGIGAGGGALDHLGEAVVKGDPPLACENKGEGSLSRWSHIPPAKHASLMLQGRVVATLGRSDVGTAWPALTPAVLRRAVAGTDANC